MSQVPDSYGAFWEYISQTQKDLLLEGDYMTNEVIRHHSYKFKDYSFLIFPYAKAYEGFLKQLFLDIGFLTRLDYISNHLRLGKLMSPNLVGRLGERSLYIKMKKYGSEELANEVWECWKIGRNQVFHYFPHNIKALTFDEAEQVISQIIKTMSDAYIQLKEKNTIESVKS
jgi:hypothetical protein